AVGSSPDIPKPPSSLCSPQFLTLVGRHVGERRLLAELQGAYIGYDRPPVPWRYSRSVTRHGAKAVGNDVEVLAYGFLPKPVDMERRRWAESALYHHPLAVAKPPVTRTAIYVEALPSPLQYRPVYRDRQFGDRFVAGTPGVESFLGAELASRHRAFHRQPRRCAVLKKGAGRQRPVLWLIVHILPAACQSQRKTQCGGRPRQCECKPLRVQLQPPPSCSRSLLESFWSRQGRTSDRVPGCAGRTGPGSPGRNGSR